MGAPSNRIATLESQMIPMIQDVPGQTLTPPEFHLTTTTSVTSAIIQR
jgi:hypothetical protein